MVGEPAEVIERGIHIDQRNGLLAGLPFRHALEAGDNKWNASTTVPEGLLVQ